MCKSTYAIRTAALLLAAEIAKFDHQSAPSLSEQYQTVDKECKDNRDSLSRIDDFIKQLADHTAVTAQIDAGINDAKSRLSTVIEPLASECVTVYKSYSPNAFDFHLGVLETNNKKVSSIF